MVRYVDRLPELPKEPETAAAPEPPDEATVARIARRADYVYPYAPVAAALSKHTASAVNEERFNPEYFARSVPAFLSASAMTPADRGTATHKFLQYCDFAACKTAPEGERERLVERGRLTRAEADCVDMESVRTFVLSDLMRRCEQAEQVFREQEFTISKSVCDMDPAIPEQFRDEKTVVIGKIDMVFTEPDGAVIVDYKTDNVKRIESLRERYADQLTLYAEAFTRITGVPVKERVLYSLKLRQSRPSDPPAPVPDPRHGSTAPRAVKMPFQLTVTFCFS
jgi:ATP-dependent helicase/nuclease subunit A